MKINIQKLQDHYRADCEDLPGMPPIGLGESPEMAVACLFYRMMFDGFSTNWLQYIRKQEPIIINDKIWDWPPSYKK